ncbi:hypothetical protein L6452_37219 [Arctium lappa]|uniref:Uncharacterized protein n=1 Tax=Arctium lappa TaxID=4217 RepID=A0ACB8Y2V9_ARCLA|nr:hypothetical protein L6452_37219 [Arctium lappa]
MTFNLENPSLVFLFVTLGSSLFVITHSSFLSLELLDIHGKVRFEPALGTWYGDPKGTESTGGACGWGNVVQSPPLSSMIAAGNARIYLQGKGCGNCYQIKCSQRPYCSGHPVIVTITDECPGCNDAPFHFDLSGTAFGAMSSPGQADNLRNLGRVNIQYRRVPCNYRSTKIAFKIDAGTNPNWFATVIEFEDGDGGLRSVEIAASHSQQFVLMKNIWGAVWQADINPSFHAPFSFKLTSPTNKVIIARNAVPKGFVPGKTYFSNTIACLRGENSTTELRPHSKPGTETEVDAEYVPTRMNHG